MKYNESLNDNTSGTGGLLSEFEKNKHNVYTTSAVPLNPSHCNIGLTYSMFFDIFALHFYSNWYHTLWCEREVKNGALWQQPIKYCFLNNIAVRPQYMPHPLFANNYQRTSYCLSASNPVFQMEQVLLRS